MKKTSIILCCYFLIIACTETESKLPEFEFILGKWKRENKDQFEVWEKDHNGEINGHAYKIVQGKQKLMETLVIKKVGDQIILEPTVPDQNEGKPVQFVLNTSIKAYFSFENPAHDFPKKIQYQKLDEQSIKVKVSGSDGEGFSFIQTRVEN